MKYYYQIEGLLRNNIGDVLQGIVAKQFLPKDALVADRENLKGISSAEDGLLIGNGWYMHSFENFPPNNNITPLYFSVHIAQSALLKSAENRAHFKKHGPIGCRDKKTLKLFLGWGIPAYYSNCLTITAGSLKGLNTNGIKTDEVLLVDNIDHQVPDTILKHLETLYEQKIIRVSHDPASLDLDFDSYANESEKHMLALLNRYKAAKLVITTKIHSALPCLGIGANVLLIHPNPGDPRLETVSQYLNVISFDEIKHLKSAPSNMVDTKALQKAIKFIKQIAMQGTLRNENPIKFGNNLKYSWLYFKSVFLAFSYRKVILLLLFLGVKNEKLIKVYR